jgi:aspartate-semialdehyde dehydrogenase
MKIAIVGASGLVGRKMIEVLAERKIEYEDLFLCSSEKSVGKIVEVKGKSIEFKSVSDVVKLKPDVALFSAGGKVSLEWAPKFAEARTYVIDNSSAWRMFDDKKLIVPEVNGNILTKEDRIIANPNCSTIQLVVILDALHKNFDLKRVVVSTYQSVSGSGLPGISQLQSERRCQVVENKAYPHPIDMNCLPHGGDFLENGYTKEEMKLVDESRKILGIPDLKLTSTVVRVPVVGGHSESVNVEMEKDFEVDQVRKILSEIQGVVVQDDPGNNIYPMPINTHNKDEIFVGRIRRDESVKSGLNLWIVADNLRKGAATNALQILELIRKKGFIK